MENVALAGSEVKELCEAAHVLNEAMFDSSSSRRRNTATMILTSTKLRCGWPIFVIGRSTFFLGGGYRSCIISALSQDLEGSLCGATPDGKRTLSTKEVNRLMTHQAPKGAIFNIQLNSTEDGPGIRTTVFLKGCPMRCPWCHNPESINKSPELVWYETRCIGDQKCVGQCPEKALTLTEKGIVIDRKLCNACGVCVDACPASALERLGKEYTVDEVADIVLRDKIFYDKSGGGMTLSGGEPAMQPLFSAALMESVKRQGVHVALDTCLGAGWNVLRPLVELADLVLIDIKTMDKNAHLRFTGIELKKVLENARSIAQTGKPLWVRTPVIPGCTDKPEMIRSVARFIRDNLPSATRYDILAFNKICEPKYTRLGLPWNFAGIDLLTQDFMAGLAEAAKAEGVGCARWSGLTRIQDAD